MNINTRVRRLLTSRTGALDHERLDRGSRKLRKHGRSHVNVGVVVPERRELRAGCGVNEEWSVETLLRGGKRRKLGRKNSRETLHPRTYNMIRAHQRKSEILKLFKFKFVTGRRVG
jgi:hypothetical protein